MGWVSDFPCFRESARSFVLVSSWTKSFSVFLVMIFIRHPFYQCG